jgi:hypothetical protein
MPPKLIFQVPLSAPPRAVVWTFVLYFPNGKLAASATEQNASAAITGTAIANLFICQAPFS